MYVELFIVKIHTFGPSNIFGSTHGAGKPGGPCSPTCPDGPAGPVLPCGPSRPQLLPGGPIPPMIPCGPHPPRSPLVCFGGNVMC